MAIGGQQNGNTGHPSMESKFVKYHRYIEFTLSRDLTNCERLRPKSVYDRKRETVPRYRLLNGKQELYTLIKTNNQTKSFFHRLSRLLGTSHRHCKRAGLTKGVNRSPGPTIYHALMLNASSVSSIRETVCIAS